MSEFKYRFVNLILLAILGFGIYWAFTAIDNGIIYDKNSDVVSDNSSKNENSVPSEEVVLFDNTKTKDNVVEDKKEEKKLSPEEEVLLGKLQGLIDDKVYMKKGSQGTRVGSVQEFLNIYFNTNKIIDNDYGPGTMSDVKKFQENEGIDADGLSGPETYKDMILILDK